MLVERHHEVLLIEQEDEVGGLLRSRNLSSGYTFDTGTHFLVPTSIPEVNDLIFQDLPLSHCYQFKNSLLEGNYFNGVFNSVSGSIDTRTLSKDIHARGLVELLSASKDTGTHNNLKEKLVTVYGTTFTQHVFEPILRSFTGCSLEDLHPSANLPYLLTRLIVLGSEASIQIKKSDLYDSKIAWTKNSDGTSNILKLYPKTGGAGRWIAGLEERIRKLGVTIITGSSISSLEIKNANVSAVILDNTRTIELDSLVWTVPAAAFLKIAKVPITSPPPSFRPVKIFDFIFDAEILTDRHFVCCYDPDMVSFRITLYPNIPLSPRANPPHHLTVEVFSEEEDLDVLRNRVTQELITMGIIPKENKTLHFNSLEVRPGWPIITNDFFDKADETLSLAQGVANNITFVGRGKGPNSHFMVEVLEQVYGALP